MTGQMSTGSPGVFSAFFSIGRSGGGDGREVGPRRVTTVALALATAAALLGTLLVLFLARPARADNGFSVAKTIWPVSGSCNGLGSSPVGATFDHYEGFVGVPISFCVVVSNSTTEPVQNIVVIDDNATPTDATDDFPLVLTDATGAPLTSLAAGFKGYAIYTYTPTSIGAFTNTLNATGDAGPLATPVSSSDMARYDIYDLRVEKTSDAGASVTEGDMVTFTFTVINDADSVDVSYLLTGLNDTVFGDLTDVGANPTSTCAALVGQMVPPLGGSVTCQLTVTMDVPGLYVPTDFAPGAGGTHTNAVDAVGEDQYGNAVTRTDGETFIVEDAPASITVTKVATPSQVTAPGEMVDFAISVTNTSAVDVVELDVFSDDVFGNLDADCLIDPSTTPPTSVAAVILGPGQTHTCSTIAWMISGDPGDVHTNTVSVSGSDDEDQPVTGEATEEVEIVGESSIDLVKTANPVSVTAPGDDVTFTFKVTNTGQTTVTLTSLMDTTFLDLTDTVAHPTSTCATAGVAPLAPGDTYTCELIEFLSGAVGDQHYNLATFCATDGTLDTNGDPVEVCAADDETVDFVEPAEVGSIKIRKRADLSEVPESGADVTFRFIISNTGGVNVTLTELTDTVYGDLSVECGIDDAAGTPTPVVLVPAPGPGDSYECEIVRNVSGDAGSEHKNRVTATGEDANGNEVDDRATRKIQIVDEPSAMSVVKTANPTSVPAAGGSVDFTFAVTNDSTSDSIDVTSLIDSVYGDLTTDCGWDVAPPQLAPGETATCVITRTVVPTTGSGSGGGTSSSATPSSTSSSQSYLSPPAPAACSGSAWVAGANSALGSHTGHSLILNTGLSVPAGTWSVDDFTAWDADIDRPNYPQAAEIVRIEFHLNGTLVAASDATADLPDGTVTAWVSGGLGSVTLPNGADEVKIVHSNSFDGTTGTNSLQPISLCLVQELTTPVDGGPHTNTGTACATDDDGSALCAGAEATVTFDAVDEPAACVGGRSRWWRNHQSDWAAPYTPSTSVQTLFTPVSIDWSMNQALGLGGNSSLAGRERQLVREATAAILNESANPSAYPVSSVAIIQQAVDNALASGSRSEMLRVARILFRWNRDVCA